MDDFRLSKDYDMTENRMAHIPGPGTPTTFDRPGSEGSTNATYSEVVLEAVNICKSFARPGGDLRILSDINLRVYPGESIGIVGSSGAGKSTLLHILGALDRPTSGSVLFQGRDLSKMTEDELAIFRGSKMGFVFQFHHLLPEMTALENVALPLRLAGVAATQANKEAERWLKQLGLDGRLTHYPNEMSGGEQQRVAVARAVVRQPPILFADEPTGNLDSVSSQMVQELLFQLRRELNLAMIVVTHDQKFASRFSRRLMLHDGSFRAAPLP